MKSLPGGGFACVIFSALLLISVPAVGQPHQLDKAEVLPLALDNDFSFRKVQLQLNDEETDKPTADRMIRFERQRVNFGAITNFDRESRKGHYFRFFWKARREADLTVRLEYRQANLGAYVLAKEVDYPAARGSHKTEFAVIGDEYFADGKVTQWRALLIEKGRVVGLTQSFLWN